MKRGLSQEGLKWIACVTMLIDHVGAVVVEALFTLEASSGGSYARELLTLYEMMRTVGRLAFPIYCFLLTEGAHHTRNPSRYALRLAVAAILSELPYDLAFYGEWTIYHQNVMLTLLLGFCALELMKRCPNIALKLLAAIPFMLLADHLNTDYGGDGVLLIALFALTRELPHRWLWHMLAIWFVFSPSHVMMVNWLGGITITIQEWAVLAAVPISLYSGEKRSHSKVQQWAFYLFYPVHLLAVYGCLFLI